MTTSYCYDPFNLRHHLSGHPENRARLAGTWELLHADGILADLLATPCTPASDEQLLRVHSRRHLSTVAQAAQRNAHLDSDTYVGSDSEQAARLAAGGLCNVVGAVLGGQASNGFALVRPPGHHATPERGMGFCLYNNVAIAARAAQAEHGLERVLVVDFDVHHGNGTQDAFYEDGSVLFFSTHQHPYYPGTGHWREMGRGAGGGATVNVPFPAGVGDAGYAAAFDSILTPAARRFQPQLILVSAGYDAHWNDPLASHAAHHSRLCRAGGSAAGAGGRAVRGPDGLRTGRGLSPGGAGPRGAQHPAPAQRPIPAHRRSAGAFSLGERDASALLAQVRQIHDLSGAS
jgi:acetoin utilization deacetylase AcuC-like enzyme